MLRSSGSVASNYAEANNPVSSADFSFRLKICRKESGESRLWIRLLASTSSDDRIPILRGLFKEADELTRIRRDYPHLWDDDFVATNRERWLS